MSPCTYVISTHSASAHTANTRVSAFALQSVSWPPLGWVPVSGVPVVGAPRLWSLQWLNWLSCQVVFSQRHRHVKACWPVAVDPLRHSCWEHFHKPLEEDHI